MRVPLCSNMLADQGMENYGIKVLKEWLLRPHPSNVVMNAALLQAIGGRIASFVFRVTNVEGRALFGGDYRPVIDGPTAIPRLRAAFRFNLSSIIKQEVLDTRRTATPHASESIPARCLVPVIVGPSEELKSIDADPEYVHHFGEVMSARVDYESNRALRGELGGRGSVGNASKKRLFNVVSAFRRMRNNTVKQTQKNRVKQLFAMAVLFNKRTNELFYPFYALDADGNLFTNQKSSALSAFDEIFFSLVPDRHALRWIDAGRSIAADGKTINENYICRPGRADICEIEVVVRDGPRDMRRVRPWTSSVANPTGYSQWMSILWQFSGSDFIRGVKESYFGMETGGCYQKMLAEQCREMNVTSSSKRTTQFNEGDLGKVPSTYFPQVFSDRARGGGRDQILSVGGRLIRGAQAGNLPSNDMASLNRLLDVRPNVVLGLCGLGDSSSARGDIVELTRAMDGAIKVATSGHTNKLEDVAQCFIALQYGIARGKHTEMIAADTDYWKILMLLVSKGLYERTQAQLFVRFGDDKIMNIMDAVAAVESHEGLAFLPKSHRVPFVIIADTSLGGDTTGSIRGRTHLTGMREIMLHAEYIGDLLRVPTAQERAQGFSWAVDLDAFNRMTMILYASMHKEVVVAARSIGASNDGEFLRRLHALGYVGLEKAIAQKCVPDVMKFMPSLINNQYCLGRVQARFNTHFVADIAEADLVKCLGISIDFEDQDGSFKTVIEPKQGSLGDCVITRVRPLFEVDSSGKPTNRSSEFYFGPDGPAVHSLSKSVEKAKKQQLRRDWKCGTCQCPSHGKDMCSKCKVNPCIHRCRRCFHVQHVGSKCDQCLPSLLNKRANCIEHCGDCLHPGTQTEHHRVGCGDCPEGAGCKTLAALLASGSESGIENGGVHGESESEEETEDLQTVLETIGGDRADMLLAQLDGLECDSGSLIGAEIFID
jgi:hypothetical protein